MTRKKSRMHDVHLPKATSVIGVISPLKIFLRARRPGGRAGQVFDSGKVYSRARAKRTHRKEVA